MIDEYCAFLRGRNYPGLRGVYLGFAPQKAPRPLLVVRRVGGDPLSSLDHNDGSLMFTDVEHQVIADNALDSVPIAGQIKADLEQCWPVNLTTRQLVAAIVEEPEDFADPPPDGSDNWSVGTQFNAQLQTAG